MSQLRTQTREVFNIPTAGCFPVRAIKVDKTPTFMDGLHADYDVVTCDIIVPVQLLYKQVINDEEYYCYLLDTTDNLWIYDCLHLQSKDVVQLYKYKQQYYDKSTYLPVKNDMVRIFTHTRMQTAGLKCTGYVFFTPIVRQLFWVIFNYVRPIDIGSKRIIRSADADTNVKYVCEDAGEYSNIIGTGVTINVHPCELVTSECVVRATESSFVPEQGETYNLHKFCDIIAKDELQFDFTAADAAADSTADATDIPLDMQVDVLPDGPLVTFDDEAEEEARAYMNVPFPVNLHVNKTHECYADVYDINNMTNDIISFDVTIPLVLQPYQQVVNGTPYYCYIPAQEFAAQMSYIDYFTLSTEMLYNKDTCANSHKYYGPTKEIVASRYFKLFSPTLLSADSIDAVAHDIVNSALRAMYACLRGHQEWDCALVDNTICLRPLSSGKAISFTCSHGRYSNFIGDNIEITTQYPIYSYYDEFDPEKQVNLEVPAPGDNISLHELSRIVSDGTGEIRFDFVCHRMQLGF